MMEPWGGAIALESGEFSCDSFQIYLVSEINARQQPLERVLISLHHQRYNGGAEFKQIKV